MSERRRVIDEIRDWLIANNIDPNKTPMNARVTLLPRWIVIDTFRSGPGGGILLYRDGRGERWPYRQKTVAQRTVEPSPIVSKWIAGEITERELWYPVSEVSNA